MSLKDDISKAKDDLANTIKILGEDVKVFCEEAYAESEDTEDYVIQKDGSRRPPDFKHIEAAGAKLSADLNNKTSTISINIDKLIQNGKDEEVLSYYTSIGGVAVAINKNWKSLTSPKSAGQAASAYLNVAAKGVALLAMLGTGGSIIAALSAPVLTIISGLFGGSAVKQKCDKINEKKLLNDIDKLIKEALRDAFDEQEMKELLEEQRKLAGLFNDIRATITMWQGKVIKPSQINKDREALMQLYNSRESLDIGTELINKLETMLDWKITKRGINRTNATDLAALVKGYFIAAGIRSTYLLQLEILFGKYETAIAELEGTETYTSHIAVLELKRKLVHENAESFLNEVKMCGDYPETCKMRGNYPETDSYRFLYAAVFRDWTIRYEIKKLFHPLGKQPIKGRFTIFASTTDEEGSEKTWRQLVSIQSKPGTGQITCATDKNKQNKLVFNSDRAFALFDVVESPPYQLIFSLSSGDFLYKIGRTDKVWSNNKNEPNPKFCDENENFHWHIQTVQPTVNSYRNCTITNRTTGSNHYLCCDKSEDWTPVYTSDNSGNRWNMYWLLNRSDFPELEDEKVEVIKRNKGENQFGEDVVDVTCCVPRKT